MIGYIKRNHNGIKEIREGDVRPPWDMNYAERRTMGPVGWGIYWDVQIKWDLAKIIKVHPGVYWVFPEEGKIEYKLFGIWAVPIDFDENLLLPEKTYSQSAMSRKFERLIHSDGGYKARRNSKDGGL